ncbi:MAG: lysophospholipid acyltransferase family protein [Acidobacteria bacterium]|nr:lysophospholipid acyltransferase family protein [Acidobacteriota bacterium]
MKRLQVALIAALGYPLIAALGCTLRWRVEGRHYLDEIMASGRQPIFAFWHGRILAGAYFFRHRGIVVMTSENFDGEWIARIIERFGYRTARGSTSRGARHALHRLAREMAEGRAAAFTLDGPRGPAYRAQPGAVWLAKVTGNPVLPFHVEAARHWTLGSWDGAQIPKPFSVTALAIGLPIEIARDADDRVIETNRQQVERSLASLRARALTMLDTRATAP